MTHDSKRQGDLSKDSQRAEDYLTADELLAKLEGNLRPRSRNKKAKGFWSTNQKKEVNKQRKQHHQNPAPKSEQPAGAAHLDHSNQAKTADRPVANDWTKQEVDVSTLADQDVDVSALADQTVANLGQSASDGQAIDQSQSAHAEDNALVKGSFWLSLGNIVSRLLGAVYILPWLAMLGAAANQGNALFSQGYNIYAILLSIATFGFPSAISKVMAQLIAKKDQLGLWSLTKKSLQIGLVLGLVFSLLLYVAAPWLSNGNAEVVPVLHSLAPAVLVFPVMSMIRGIFQGHQLMHISALSDILEQVGRVIYLLVATWLVLSHDSSNWTGAVVQSTFAAFIGALFSLSVLGYGWVRYARLIHPAADGVAGQDSVDQNSQATTLTRHGHGDKEATGSRTLAMVGNILKESWPFVVIGSSTNLFLFVDQYTFFPLMKAFFHTSLSELQIQFALFSANPNKLVMIVISFATSIAATALPILAAKKAEGNLTELRTQLIAVLRLTSLVLIPAALGMYAVSGPLYRFFYPIDYTVQEGVYLLQFSAILTIIMSLFMLLAFVLQALSHGREVMRAFGWGFLIKLIIQAPLLYLFQGMGALIATAIGLGWSLALMLHFLKNNYHVSFATIHGTLLKTYLASIAMALVAYLVAWLSETYLLAANSKVGAGLSTGLAVTAGLLVLLVLYRRFGLLKQVLSRGQRPNTKSE